MRNTVFDEFIYGELENLFSIKDESFKKSLVRLMLDPKKTALDIFSYARRSDPLISPYLLVLSCYLLPTRWKDFSKYRIFGLNKL